MPKNPTVHPAPNFNADDDATALKKAFRGIGTDETAIIKILTHRSNEQRQEIAKRFKIKYGQELTKELKGELRGHFEDLMVALLLEPVEFQAKELHRAIAGLGTDEEALVEILSIHDNDEIKEISKKYEALYKTTLEKDIKGDTSGTVRRILVSLATACRDESEETDKAKAVQDAQTLLNAGEKILGTHETPFIEILCTRNRNQVQLIFDEYRRISGHTFETAVRNEFSFASKEVLLGLVHAIRNRLDYLTARLHDSMARLGTQDRTLIRIIVSRSEIDLGDIKKHYMQKYGKSLADWIKDDCSGDYKNALLALIG